jgi:hypothetical protein
MRSGALARTHLLILLVYLLLALLLTWPTVSHMATQLPGDGGDDPAIAWNLWWVKQALLTLHTNPLFSDFMFYPLGVNLAFYTLTTLNALTAMPLTLSLGVVAASNLHMWFTMLAGAYGAFLLARYLLAEIFPAGAGRGAALWPAGVAGGLYAFASSQLFYLALGQYNIASSQWVPYTVLFVLKSRRDLASLRWPALAALFLVMQAWAEMTYASFLLVFIGVYVLWEIGKAAKEQVSKSASRASQQVSKSAKRANRANLQTCKPANTWTSKHVGWGGERDPTRRRIGDRLLWAGRDVVVLGVLFGLGIAPLLAAMLPDMRAEVDFWLQGSGFAESFSADLAGFLVPTMHHPLFGDLIGRTGVANFTKAQHVYLGFTLLLLALVGLVGARRAGAGGHRSAGPRFWAGAALLFAWLSLGPTVHVNGVDTGLPGPFVILQSLPFFKGNRYPSRYGVMLVLCLAMLAAMGMAAIGRRIERGRAGGARALWMPAMCGLLAAAFLFEHVSIPLPQSDMTVPPVYRTLAAGPGQFTLLEVPLAWRNGFRITGPEHPGFMFGQFYQTVHGQRLLGGNTSRNPEFKFQYFTEAPVINSLLALETGHQLPPERWESDRAIAGDVLRFLNVGAIVVRPAPDGNPAVTPGASMPYIESVMPVERAYSDPGLTLYRVNLPPAPKTVEVSPSAPLARLYFAEGWGALADGPAWAQRRDARLLVPLDGEAQQVSLRLWAPDTAGADQTLTLRLPGWESEPIRLEPGWDEYRLALPAQAVLDGLNRVTLHFERLEPASDLAPVDGAPYRALLAESAGYEVGDFGHIYLDGVDVSPNQRGYNLAVISPQGQIQSASFDTFDDPDASARLAAFVAAVPEGYTVAVAAADEASMKLSQEAVDALRSIGAAGDLRDRFRWSHAIIGRKGAQPGTAQEALDGLRPVRVAAGPPLTEPSVAAALDWIRFKADK